mgnify:CR=1 FL=1
MNSKARTNGWSALERKICDIIQEINAEEITQSPKSDRSPASTIMTYNGKYQNDTVLTVLGTVP